MKRGKAKSYRFDCRRGNQFATKLIRDVYSSAVYPADWKGAASKVTSALGWREVEVGTS
jgi:hypothetical protein